MLKTFDIVLIGVMTTAAAVTYTIKHRAELKLEEVHHLEAEIKLEKDTIDLLKADWSLVVQPNRLERLVANYSNELQLQPTLSTSLVEPNELPMLRSQLPPSAADLAAAKPGAKGDSADADIRKVIADVASKPAPKPVAKLVSPQKVKPGTDDIKTGSVKR